MKKICNKCSIEKESCDFYKDSNKKDGLTTFCIECKKISNKTSQIKNSDKINEYNKKYREENKENIKEYNKKYREENKENIKEYNKKYREENKENIKERNKKYYEDNKDKIMEKYFNNRENELIRMKNWKKLNRKKLSEYQNNYYKERKKTDPVFKLRNSVGQLIRVSLNNKGLKKNSKTQLILGCTFDEFKQHLESKFESWMNWDNYGLYNGTPNYGWDIDHIIPNSSAINEEEVYKLNHYTNLQPLCSYHNRDVKKNKVD